MDANGNDVQGQSFELPAGASIDEDDGDFVVRDSTGAIVFRRNESAGEWQFEDADLTGISSLTTDKQSFTDADLTVSPATHDFDDIIAELNDDKHVHAMPGTYDATDAQKTVSAGSLSFADGAKVDVPAEPPGGWIVINGSTGNTTDITADVSRGDTELSVGDTSEFESGKPALISDSAGWTSMDESGEIVYIEEVVDGTTLELREGAGIAHDTNDTVMIEPVDPLTEANSWVGVTFDCTGSDQIASEAGWPLIYRNYVDGHELRNITWVNGGGSNMHQYVEDEHCYAPKLIGCRTGRVEDGDLGLFYSPEQRTRHAQARDCVVYHGQVCQFGGNGAGPSQDAVFQNILGIGSAFQSTRTEIRPEFRNCIMVNPSGDFQSENRAFAAQAYRPRYINCRAINAEVGWRLQSVGAEVINCRSRNVSEPLKVGGSTSASPSAANAEPFIIRHSVFDGFDICINSRSAIEQIRVIDSDLLGNDGAQILAGASPPDSVVFDGGYIESAMFANTGVPHLVARGVEFDADGILQFFRDTSSTVNDELVFDGCEIYNTENSGIWVENYDHLSVSGCRVPTTEAAVDNWLVREEGGSGDNVLVLRGNDGRNTNNGDGYSLTSTAISDGTNLKNDGTAF